MSTIPYDIHSSLHKNCKGKLFHVSTNKKENIKNSFQFKENLQTTRSGIILESFTLLFCLIPK